MFLNSLESSFYSTLYKTKMALKWHKWERFLCALLPDNLTITFFYDKMIPKITILTITTITTINEPKYNKTKQSQKRKRNKKLDTCREFLRFCKANKRYRVFLKSKSCRKRCMRRNMHIEHANSVLPVSIKTLSCFHLRLLKKRTKWPQSSWQSRMLENR